MSMRAVPEVPRRQQSNTSTSSGYLNPQNHPYYNQMPMSDVPSYIDPDRPSSYSIPRVHGGTNGLGVSSNGEGATEQMALTGSEDRPPLPLNRPRNTRRVRDPYVHMRPGDIHYAVDDNPPWYLCIILGFQHYLIMFGATVANPLVLAPSLCIADDDNVAKSEIIGTIFVVSGIATLLQATLGVRLPIVQGGTFTFVAPILAILSLPKWQCPAAPTDTTTVSMVTEGTTGIVGNDSMVMNVIMGNLTGGDSGDPAWKQRMREIQGAIMVASLFQVLIGFSGMMGWMLQFIGPLAIAPTISLAGLALFGVATNFAMKQWWITLVTVVLIVAFSQYTKNLDIPCFQFRRGEGCKRTPFPLFKLFPVILAIAITWAICAILTAANVFPSDPDQWGYGAQTNIRIDVLEKAPWFRFPYPGQWGLPTVSVAGVFGILAGVLASMVESVGDYYACARMSGAPPPPIHAINRGIGIEGLGCIIAGAFGSGSGTTSYSENIGAIGITKVASRRVIQVGAIVMIIMGTFGKFGALFVTIPDPIIGGVFIVMFGMITAVGISNLQFVDLNSSRNLFIIGFSFFFGLTLPQYLSQYSDSIKTGSDVADQIILVLLKTSMFVGGLSGFILDNTVPGTDEERGLSKWRKHYRHRSSHHPEDRKEGSGKKPGSEDDHNKDPMELYEIPFLTKFLKRWSWTHYVPFLPTFSVNPCERCFHRGGDEEEEKDYHRGVATSGV